MKNYLASTPDRPNIDLLKGVRVLIVEDAWHVAKALKSALEQMGMLWRGMSRSANQMPRLPLKFIAEVY